MGCRRTLGLPESRPQAGSGGGRGEQAFDFWHARSARGSASERLLYFREIRASGNGGADFVFGDVHAVADDAAAAGSRYRWFWERGEEPAADGFCRGAFDHEFLEPAGGGGFAGEAQAGEDAFFDEGFFADAAAGIRVGHAVFALQVHEGVECFEPLGGDRFAMSDAQYDAGEIAPGERDVGVFESAQPGFERGHACQGERIGCVGMHCAAHQQRLVRQFHFFNLDGGVL